MNPRTWIILLLDAIGALRIAIRFDESTLMFHQMFHVTKMPRTGRKVELGRLMVRVSGGRRTVRVRPKRRRHRISHGEFKVKTVLDSLGIKYRMEWTIPELPRRRYDFYIPDGKILIEYDGLPHFVFVRKFHRNMKGFHKAHDADILKSRTAVENGYRLIRIDYTQFHDVKEHLLRAMTSGDDIYLSSSLYNNWISP